MPLRITRIQGVRTFMSKHARDRRPYIKPVTRIELSTENFTLRWILVVLLLMVAGTCLVMGINALMETQDGWAEIEVSSDQVNCSLDFQLRYDLGAGDASATAENKFLTTLYTKATEDAYVIFSAHMEKEGVNNVAFLNAHPNETVTVDTHLYRALEKIQASGNRNIFMAPVDVQYNQVFMAQSDVHAADLDPARNDAAREYVKTLAGFAANPEMIDLELQGENQVRLHIAQEYLDFAEADGIEIFLDFSWMTNAFIIDYIADILVENGYTNGYLTSYDGFTRNLDQRGGTYHVNVFDYRDGTVYVPGVMSYHKPISMVNLRSYPMSDSDNWHYYRYEDGAVATIFTDPADGMSKCATEDLICYSYKTNCADLLLEMIPVFIADSFESQSLLDKEILSIWSEDTVVYFNDADLILEINEPDSVYRTQYTGK